VLDPPHRVAARFVKAALQTGLVGEVTGGDLVEVVRTALRGGLSAASVHRLHAALHPKRLAAVDAERSLTYREMDREIDALETALRTRFRAGRGTAVALMMENRVEYLTSWFATLRLGASSVHVSYRSTADELEYQLEHSGARILLCSEESREAAVRVRRRRRDWRLAVVDVDTRDHSDDRYSYRRILRVAERIERSGRADRGDRSTVDRHVGDSGGGNIVYTSGTTGRPKGTVRNFTKLGIHDLFRIVERLPVRAGDEHLVVAPLYHSGGQVFAILNTSLGATIHLQSHFEPRKTLEVLSDEEIHSLFLVPTMIRRLLDLPDEVHARYRTPELRALVSGAAPFPEELRRRAINRFGAGVVHDFYGATELGWATLIDGAEMRRRPGSVGRPIAGQEIRIYDGERICDPGEVGTIYVRSVHTMEGYLRDEEANEAFRRGVWATVEDLGYLDEEGYLYLAGRERDMVITGGVNVYPVEIEEVLLEHPGIEDVGVVGVEDAEWGEKLVAYLVAEEAEDPPGSEELEEWTSRRLAGYKVPKDWKFVDELPRNPTGKILKTELERTYR